jgi:hypothetical protein
MNNRISLQAPNQQRRGTLRFAHRSAVLVLMACALVASASVAAAAETPKVPSDGRIGAAPLVRGATSSTTRLLTCSGKAVFKPASYVIFCADANGILEKIEWLSWGTASAHARATYSANNCRPNCAAGKFVNYAATATLSAPKRTKYGVLFSELLVRYESGGKAKLLHQPLPLKPL